MFVLMTSGWSVKDPHHRQGDTDDEGRLKERV